MDKCPLEFGRVARLRFHAFGGHTPEMLAKELLLLKQQTEQPDISLLLCMLNGLAKYSKALQQEPAGYRQKFCDYCAAAKNSGQRVILIIGGDGAKWQIGNPELYNKIRDDYIAIAKIDYHLPAVSGAQWWANCSMADKWHLWLDPDYDTNDAYRSCVRESVDFAYACLPSAHEQWVEPGPDGYIPFGMPKEQGSILATTEKSEVKDNRTKRTVTFSREVDSTASPQAEDGEWHELASKRQKMILAANAAAQEAAEAGKESLKGKGPIIEGDPKAIDPSL